MEEDLARSVAYLIAHGHKLDDVRGYSLRQVNAFISLADKEERKSHASMVWCARIAYHADGKDYSKTLKELEK